VGASLLRAPGPQIARRLADRAVARTGARSAAAPERPRTTNHTTILCGHYRGRRHVQRGRGRTGRAYRSIVHAWRRTQRAGCAADVERPRRASCAPVRAEMITSSEQLRAHLDVACVWHTRECQLAIEGGDCQA